MKKLGVWNIIEKVQVQYDKKVKIVCTNCDHEFLLLENSINSRKTIPNFCKNCKPAKKTIVKTHLNSLPCGALSKIVSSDIDKVTCLTCIRMKDVYKNKYTIGSKRQ